MVYGTNWHGLFNFSLAIFWVEFPKDFGTF
jgi:hypothetical protein